MASKGAELYTLLIAGAILLIAGFIAFGVLEDSGSGRPSSLAFAVATGLAGTGLLVWGTALAAIPPRFDGWSETEHSEQELALLADIEVSLSDIDPSSDWQLDDLAVYMDACVDVRRTAAVSVFREELDERVSRDWLQQWERYEPRWQRRIHEWHPFKRPRRVSAFSADPYGAEILWLVDAMLAHDAERVSAILPPEDTSMNFAAWQRDAYRKMRDAALAATGLRRSGAAAGFPAVRALPASACAVHAPAAIHA